jgi:hypothetical protein
VAGTRTTVKPLRVRFACRVTCVSPSCDGARPTRRGGVIDDVFNLGFPLRPDHRWSRRKLPRKEVIQPHLPVGLPCYDLVPITDPTFDSCPLAVGALASGIADFRDLTGGVYKPREHIHRCVLTSGY